MDEKFYQDVPLDYQNTYLALLEQQVELQGKFSMQSSLIEEASVAIKATKAEAKKRHQELLNFKCKHQTEVESAVIRVVE